MKLFLSLISCVYSRVKLFVFEMNISRRYFIFVCFIYGLEEKNSKSEVIFAVSRLPLTSCLTSLICHRIFLKISPENCSWLDHCLWKIKSAFKPCELSARRLPQASYVRRQGVLLTSPSYLMPEYPSLLHTYHFGQLIGFKSFSPTLRTYLTC